MKRDTAALLVCAGNATRMGGIHKILHPLGESAVLTVGLEALCACPSVAEIVIVCRQQDEAEFRETLAQISCDLPVTLVHGGATRQASVHNGIRELSGRTEFVAIHDGARPLVLPEDIEKVIADARKTGAAALGVPVKDTVKIVRDGIIAETPDRSLLWLTQTPQVFRLRLYLDAMAIAEAQGMDYTDDCQLVEAIGTPVAMTAGSYTNIKLTTPEDFAVAEAFLRERSREDAV